MPRTRTTARKIRKAPHGIDPHQMGPRHLLALAQQGLLPKQPVALDTETSGLRVDDGARVSTVSVAWIDPDNEWEWVPNQCWDGGISTNRVEKIDSGVEVRVISFAWPLDQGVAGTGKVEEQRLLNPNPEGMLDLGLTLAPDSANLERADWLALLDWLRCLPDLTMHNSKFDCHQMKAGVRRWPSSGLDLMDQVGWDTQNVNDLLYGYCRSTALKGPSTPTEKFWGEGESGEKAVISEYLRKKKLPKGRWDLMPWHIIAKYADQDARLTARMRYRQELDIMNRRAGEWMDGEEGRLELRRAVERRMDVTRMLYRMEQRGLPFDVEGAWEASEQLKKRAAGFEAELPFPATLNSAKHYWFGTGLWRGIEGQGLKPISTTASGAPSLTGADMLKLIQRGLPGVDVWRQYNKATDADARWYEGWASKAGIDGRLRTSVRQNGTRSGRFSVEGIQLQAIPQSYKLSGFEVLEGVPTPRDLIERGIPEGWVMYELDLANAELRVAALFAGCTRMLDMIDRGLDLHGETAKELFHVEPDAPEWDQRRSIAKRANFSLIFGVGWEELARNIESNTGIALSERESQTLVRSWNKLYPEYRQQIDLQSRKVQELEDSSRSRGVGGYIQTANGERRWFARIEDKHKAFNQLVQPSLAQFGIGWWLQSDAYITSKLTDEELAIGGTVLLIHDSMVLLLPKGKADKIVAKVQQIGVKLWSKTFPGVPGGVDAKPWNH